MFRGTCRVNRERRTSGKVSERAGKERVSARDATGKEKVTFSGDRPTNRDIIGSNIFMHICYILRSLTDFPSIYFYPLLLPFDLHFLRLLPIYWTVETGVRVYARVWGLSIGEDLVVNFCRKCDRSLRFTKDECYDTFVLCFRPSKVFVPLIGDNL